MNLPELPEGYVWRDNSIAKPKAQYKNRAMIKDLGGEFHAMYWVDKEYTSTWSEAQTFNTLDEARQYAAACIWAGLDNGSTEANLEIQYRSY